MCHMHILRCGHHPRPGHPRASVASRERPGRRRTPSASPWATTSARSPSPRCRRLLPSPSPSLTSWNQVGRWWGMLVETDGMVLAEDMVDMTCGVWEDFFRQQTDDKTIYHEFYAGKLRTTPPKGRFFDCYKEHIELKPSLLRGLPID